MQTTYCRHIRPSGRRCQAFALRSKPFCFHHATVAAHLRTLHPPDDGTHNAIHDLRLQPGQLQREPLVADYYAHTRAPIELDFPSLEDADAVQLALSMVLTALGQNRIDPKRAAPILYGLRLASTNARFVSQTNGNTVTDTTTDDSGNLLSPDEDPEEIRDLNALLDEMEQEEAVKAQTRAENPDNDEEDDEDDYDPKDF